MVINTSWNIYNFRKHLVDFFLDRGNELYLIAPRDQYSEKIAQWQAQYIELPMDNTGSNPIRDLMLLWRFYWIYREIKPDIILHYTIKPNIYGSIAARLQGIPCINNVSGLGTIFLKQNLSTAVAKHLYRLAFSRHCHVFFQNKDDASDFRRDITFKASYTIIPGSGIDVSGDQPDLSLRSETKPLVFLMVGRLLVEKGVNEYLEAANHFAELPGVEFWLAGELDENHVRGIGVERIKKEEEAGVVKYLGHVQPIQPVMQNADWIVLPSYREGTPRSLLEAAVLSKPMITCDVPGCREVVENNVNGFLCQPKSATDLIERIEKALKLSESEKLNMGKASRKLVEERFNEQIVFEAYAQQINRMTGK